MHFDHFALVPSVWTDDLLYFWGSNRPALQTRGNADGTATAVAHASTMDDAVAPSPSNAGRKGHAEGRRAWSQPARARSQSVRRRRFQRSINGNTPQGLATGLATGLGLGDVSTAAPSPVSSNASIDAESELKDTPLNCGARADADSSLDIPDAISADLKLKGIQISCGASTCADYEPKDVQYSCGASTAGSDIDSVSKITENSRNCAELELKEIPLSCSSAGIHIDVQSKDVELEKGAGSDIDPARKIAENSRSASICAELEVKDIPLGCSGAGTHAELESKDVELERGAGSDIDPACGVTESSRNADMCAELVLKDAADFCEPGADAELDLESADRSHTPGTDAGTDLGFGDAGLVRDAGAGAELGSGDAELSHSACGEAETVSPGEQVDAVDTGRERCAGTDGDCEVEDVAASCGAVTGAIQERQHSCVAGTEPEIELCDEELVIDRSVAGAGADSHRETFGLGHGEGTGAEADGQEVRSNIDEGTGAHFEIRDVSLSHKADTRMANTWTKVADALAMFKGKFRYQAKFKFRDYQGLRPRPGAVEEACEVVPGQNDGTDSKLHPVDAETGVDGRFKGRTRDAGADDSQEGGLSCSAGTGPAEANADCNFKGGTCDPHEVSNSGAGADSRPDSEDVGRGPTIRPSRGTCTGSELGRQGVDSSCSPGTGSDWYPKEAQAPPLSGRRFDMMVSYAERLERRATTADEVVAAAEAALAEALKARETARQAAEESKAELLQLRAAFTRTAPDAPTETDQGAATELDIVKRQLAELRAQLAVVSAKQDVETETAGAACVSEHVGDSRDAGTGADDPQAVELDSPEKRTLCLNSEDAEPDATCDSTNAGPDRMSPRFSNLTALGGDDPQELLLNSPRKLSSQANYKDAARDLPATTSQGESAATSVEEDAATVVELAFSPKVFYNELTPRTESEEFLSAILDSLKAAPWKEENFEGLGKLNDAKRNSGNVDLMRCLETGCLVAVKRMPNSWMMGNPEEFSQKHPGSSERPWVDLGIVKFLYRSHFPFVCQPLGIFKNDIDTFVVSEYAAGGDLFSWCERQLSPPGASREQAMRPLLQQLTVAVGLLHTCGVAHGDLSLENIVVVQDQAVSELDVFRVKIIDFGMATLSRMVSGRACGKPPYQAPEIHARGTYDAFLADAFALGVTSYCMGAGAYPWRSTRLGDREDHIFRYVYDRGMAKFFAARRLQTAGGKRITEVFSREFRTFLGHLLEPHAARRYCVASVCYDEEDGQRLIPSIVDDEWLA